MRRLTFAGVALASGLAAAPTSALATPLHLPIDQFSLPNGLRVVVNEDHSLPVVAIAETFDVGSRDEHKGQFGFAHLFEHLMFEGSANAGKGMYDKYVAGFGGDNNASTDQDFTNYFVVIPSNAFESAMWLEADRVRALSISSDALQNQIQVVEEEFRQDVYNAPYGQAAVDLNAAAYKGSPYEHDTLGSFDDLNAASLDEVRAFHEGFYGPQNMVLVVAGDVTTAQVKAAVTTYFGTILSRTTPPRPDQTVPPHGAVHLDETDKLADLPLWQASFRIPASHTPDHYALEVLGIILAGGDSGRLPRSLIDDKRIATQAWAGPDGRRGTDMFSVYVSLLDGHTPAEAQAGFDQVVADVVKNGVDAKEIQKAENQLDMGLLGALQNRVARAEMLGAYAVNLGDPALLLAEPDQWNKVTAADVQRVAKQYLTSDNCTDIFLNPAK